MIQPSNPDDLIEGVFFVMEEEKEIFKDVPGYEGHYQVSSLGNVKSLSRIMGGDPRPYLSKEKILKPGSDLKGYRFVILWKNKEPHNHRIHVLVAMAFLGHVPGCHKLVVNHIDGNNINNKLRNLELVTHRANTSSCFRIDRYKFSSPYVGVCRRKNRSRWRSAICINGKITSLGSFDTEIEASDAYQAALNRL